MEPRLLLSRDLYVDLTSPSLAPDGTSWASAYPDLQQALSAATTGDRLLIADGTYQPTSATDRTISFALKEGVSLLGGYAGYGAANPDARDTSLYPTLLSGDIGTPGTNTDNSYHVLTASSITSATVLDGLTITAGNANGASTLEQDRGGGMYSISSSPALTNCTFSGNAARANSGSGGAVYSRGYNLSAPPLTLTNCNFIGNTAYQGGGISSSDFPVALTDCTFSANSANSGGGMSSSAPLTLTNCTFRNNSALFNGGGLGIAFSSSSSLINCTFISNSASAGGGLHISGQTSPALTNCTFVGNSADYGGGLYNAAAPALANCTVIGNSADSGGGFYNTGSPTLAHCTFAANASATYGGAFHNNNSPTLSNCILWACGTTPFYSYHMGSPAIRYSDIQGSFTGTGNIDADPKFVRSPWAGPDGRFGTADDDLGDLRLRSGSPAVNMGAYGVSTSVPAPKTLYVDGSAVGANSGSSWTDAFTSLQSALAAAADGDTIRVADGTYKPTSTTDRSITFALRNNVAVYGGYAGYGAANPDARDVRLYPTILSGDIGIAGNTSDNSYHVVVGIGLLAPAVLDGFTITAGSAAPQDDGRYTTYGGGMVSFSSSMTVNDCTFSGNSTFRGGGMAVVGSSAPAITNCLFAANSANSGGGMYTQVSSPSMRNCTFLRNSATYGGGICTDSWRNEYPAFPTLANASFFGNTADIGGGMYNDQSEPIVSDALFIGNSARQGGGVYNYTYYGSFTNCTLSGNVATTGSAMYTIMGLTPPTLANLIVWGNGTSPLYTEGTLTISRSDIEGGGNSNGNFDADPQFVRTPSPGLDGAWGTADDDYGNLRLRYTSPCIDAGSNGNLVGMTTDLASNPRFVDVPSVPDTGYGSKPLVDLGVYEMPATPDTTPPTIISVLINDGAAQRSMVRKVTVTFSEPMSLVPGALTVKLSSGQVVPNTTIILSNPSADQKSYLLTFSGAGVIGASLADGIYDLLISASGAQDLAGNPLTGNYTQRFHRLFGDADGNKVVNALDYAKLKATYGRSAADPLFNSAFDYENNGVINALDLAQFRKRYGLSFSY